MPNTLENYFKLFVESSFIIFGVDLNDDLLKNLCNPFVLVVVVFCCSDLLLFLKLNYKKLQKFIGFRTFDLRDIWSLGHLNFGLFGVKIK